MSLADLIYKKRRGEIANANRANPANGEDQRGGEVSNVSDISVRETLINEPVVRITDEAGCNFQIDVGI
ncbi:hypothetical protein [Burkholderia cenocepacia]|uniref:hypothetical protein n=1 Tax=Burkholderia cenocepacia TaxID=95486 RepID=UPI001177CA09|nr:hypothetical protein [Burkholderia cenocepacia]